MVRTAKSAPYLGNVGYENLDALAAAHAAGRGVKLESALDGMPVPLHAGAARYYKEKGLKLP